MYGSGEGLPPGSGATAAAGSSREERMTEELSKTCVWDLGGGWTFTDGLTRSNDHAGLPGEESIHDGDGEGEGMWTM